jgi:6-pyruvoyltetrahydropterin/6-carboxytetrahydropterin synthase
MLALSRTVRFAINPPGSPPNRGVNGFAGNPPLCGLGRHYEVLVRCTGQADPATGYLIDIKDIDRAVRDAVMPIIARACDFNPNTDPAPLLPSMCAALGSALGPGFSSLRWMLSPYHSVEMAAADTKSALLRQRFDFSASHRLHIPKLSDEENRRLFGKCNNPTGHGHNYQLEPCVAVPLDASGRSALDLDTLERLTDQAIIKRFDHKNLSVDAPEFRVDAGGVNATVENIARVFFELLAPALRRQAPGAELRAITVWETDRTSATYPAG